MKHPAVFSILYFDPSIIGTFELSLPSQTPIFLSCLPGMFLFRIFQGILVILAVISQLYRSCFLLFYPRGRGTAASF